MKKSTQILLTVLLTISYILLSSCGRTVPEESDGEISKTDVSTYTPRDYLSEWSGKELEVRVADVMNDSAVIGLPSEIYVHYPYDDERAIARRKAVEERFEKRFNEYYKDRDVQDTITVDIFGETMTLERKKTFSETCLSEKKRDISYETHPFGGYIRYTKDGMLAACENYSIKKHKPSDNAQKVFNNFDEALELAKKFISDNVEIVEDFDKYTFSKIYMFDVDPLIYGITFEKRLNGIKVSTVNCLINEYIGICGFRTFNCEKDTMDFYSSCVEYATTPDAINAAKERLKIIAADNPDIVEIKDIKRFNNGRGKGYYDEHRKAYYPAYEEYGRVNYYEYLDKTGVDLCFEYTAVMNDGTEKRGINVVTVFIPIDWAEEFGEK